MNRIELLHKKAELGFLEKISKDAGLSKATARSLAGRMKRAQGQIASSPESAYRPAGAILTFRGDPVWGTHGVLAEFGASATGAFTEAVASIAASISGTLAGKGPIPNRCNNQLLITGTALGSFGFQLEEAPAGVQLDIEGTTPTSQALELIVELLEATTRTDEELSEPVSKLADRAISAVTEFLSKLVSYNASCSLTTDSKKFQFSGVEEVRTSISRLSRENIKESVEFFSGVFAGTLPDKRTFEFRTSDGHVIYGSIPADLVDPDEINQHLYSNVKISVNARRIGNSKPRYSLASIPWL